MVKKRKRGRQRRCRAGSTLESQRHCVFTFCFGGERKTALQTAGCTRINDDAIFCNLRPLQSFWLSVLTLHTIEIMTTEWCTATRSKREGMRKAGRRPCGVVHAMVGIYGMKGRDMP